MPEYASTILKTGVISGNIGEIKSKVFMPFSRKIFRASSLSLGKDARGYIILARSLSSVETLTPTRKLGIVLKRLISLKTSLDLVKI